MPLSPSAHGSPTPPTDATGTVVQVTLFSDADGRACFRDDPIVLDDGTPASRLSRVLPTGGLQWRESPAGFRSSFHVTTTPQWVFILRGQMEINLQDGSARVFGPGAHFYSADVLPAGATFDAAVHGHWSRALGDEPLVTAFVRDGAAPPAPTSA